MVFKWFKCENNNVRVKRKICDLMNLIPRIYYDNTKVQFIVLCLVCAPG